MVKPMHLEFETTVPPPQMVRALRELISEVGWEKERTEGSRMVDRWAIIMPIATHARTLGHQIWPLDRHGNAVLVTHTWVCR